jgi:hypothetical protein
MYYYKLLINRTVTYFSSTRSFFSQYDLEVFQYDGHVIFKHNWKIPNLQFSTLFNRSGHIIVLMLSVPITYIMAYEYLRPLLIVTRSFNTCSGFIYNPSKEINNNRYCRLTYFYNMSSTLHVYVQITVWCLGAYKNIRELIKIILRLYFVYALVMSVLFIKQQEFYYQYKCVYLQSKYFSKRIYIINTMCLFPIKVLQQTHIKLDIFCVNLMIITAKDNSEITARHLSKKGDM